MVSCGVEWCRAMSSGVVRWQTFWTQKSQNILFSIDLLHKTIIFRLFTLQTPCFVAANTITFLQSTAFCQSFRHYFTFLWEISVILALFYECQICQISLRAKFPQTSHPQPAKDAREYPFSYNFT
jgi:hypothetical protein